jgi:23S rRNA (guanine745-N1)-methyltransferase
MEALACPVCGSSLRTEAGALICPARHTFNLARAGYASFAGGKPRLADSPAMVRARAAFLATGHYEPIARAVATQVGEALDEMAGAAEGTARKTAAEAGAPLILDLAGGTGYYLAGTLDAVPQSRGLVLDLAPAAARLAARCHPRAAAATADVWGRLPLRDASVAHTVSVFGPRGSAELARVTEPGGGLTVVTPAPDHLAELRAGGWMVGIGGDKTGRLDRKLEGFRLMGRAAVSTRAELSPADAADLVMMGPTAFHVDRETAERRLRELRWPLGVSVSIVLSRYRRWPATG